MSRTAMLAVACTECLTNRRNVTCHDEPLQSIAAIRTIQEGNLSNRNQGLGACTRCACSSLLQQTLPGWQNFLTTVVTSSVVPFHFFRITVWAYFYADCLRREMEGNIPRSGNSLHALGSSEGSFPNCEFGFTQSPCPLSSSSVRVLSPALNPARSFSIWWVTVSATEEAFGGTVVSLEAGLTDTSARATFSSTKVLGFDTDTECEQTTICQRFQT